MKNQANVVICPPCGEQSLAPEGFNPGVAVATKEGQHRNNALWPLLPRLTAVLPPQGREMICGFTLIELLVVVLIIGILAAVAVPQYQKAVFKSRFTQVQIGLNAYMKGIDLYVLSNGFPTEDVAIIDQVDIEMHGGTYRNSSTAFKFGHFGCVCIANEFCGVGFSDASIEENGAFVPNPSPWLEGKVYVSKQADGGQWFLNNRTYSDNDEKLKMICQWWASAYGTEYMQDEIKTKCTTVGVN